MRCDSSLVDWSDDVSTPTLIWVKIYYGMPNARELIDGFVGVFTFQAFNSQIAYETNSFPPRSLSMAFDVS